MTYRQATSHHPARTEKIGDVTITSTRLPAGGTVVLPSGADRRALQLVVPVDSTLVVRERDAEQYLVGTRGLAWFPAWSAAAVCSPREGEVRWVDVPARLLGSRGSLSEPLPPRPAPGSALVEPVRAFLEAASSARSPLPPAGAGAGAGAVTALSGRLFEELLGAMIDALFREARGAGATAGAVRPPLRVQAVAHIAANRADPALSSERIARALRISVRQLQRAFEEAGTTVGAEVRRQRLDAAVRMLTDESFDALAVSEIAARAGFRNDAELRRALAACTGGATPSRLRTQRSTTLARVG
ncbi:helix-turn-helix domain-containing protein [Herbiconiux sp. 11R-BC]|uniref:helix-turn-helix domain-containing protein n=1 Tax=Herbiconiux sp. 11R-BC TaxID=3111637 RepID=UPI003BFACF60